MPSRPTPSSSPQGHERAAGAFEGAGDPGERAETNVDLPGLDLLDGAGVKPGKTKARGKRSVCPSEKPRDWSKKFGAAWLAVLSGQGTAAQAEYVQQQMEADPAIRRQARMMLAMEGMLLEWGARQRRPRR